MKQIDECLNRHFEGKRPLLGKKWQVRGDEISIVLFHYHHRIMICDLKRKKIKFEWWQVPADKRGLEAAKKYLVEKGKIVLDLD